MRHLTWRLTGLLACAFVATQGQAKEPTEALKVILAVSKEGGSNEAAAAAWKQVVAEGRAALIPTLAAFDTAGPTAANWLRAAVSAIADAEAKAKRPLDAGALEAFVRDDKRKPAARRVAYELFSAQAPADANALLATLINDPEPELRREAINERLAQAAKVSPEALAKARKELIAYARDRDQVEKLAEALSKAGDTAFDITRHFNTITRWQILGPFDNTDGASYAKQLPPEAAPFDAKAEYPGKVGPVRWRDVQSEKVVGDTDLNEVLTKHKFALTYARAVIECDADTPAEVRATTGNALKIFVNGAAVYQREVYHNGKGFDAHVAPVVLRKGRNEILLKVCQDDQKMAWTQAWGFGARVCDATGGKIPVRQVVVTPAGAEAVVPLGDLKPATEPKDAPKDQPKKEGSK